MGLPFLRMAVICQIIAALAALTFFLTHYHH